MASVNKPNPYKPGSAAFGAEAARRKSKVGTKDVFADVGGKPKAAQRAAQMATDKRIIKDKEDVYKRLKD